MKTLFLTALNGWTNTIQQGKFMALLLLALAYLGYCYYQEYQAYREGQKCRDGKKTLFVYTLLATLGCICPVTAVALMKYQTGFYSYEWIWAYVPMTVLIAWAGTEFFVKLWKGERKRAIAGTILLLVIVYLSGNPASEWTAAQNAEIPEITQITGHKAKADTQSAYAVLDELTALAGTERIRLWAPKEIMAAARAYSGQMQPVYGRSIWDASLGAYSYDTYEAWQEDLYLWMNGLETTGETELVRQDTAPERTVDFALCLQYAGEAGVEYILLPVDLGEETLGELEAAAGRTAEPWNGYYLFTLTEAATE